MEVGNPLPITKYLKFRLVSQPAVQNLQRKEHRFPLLYSRIALYPFCYALLGFGLDVF